MLENLRARIQEATSWPVIEEMVDRIGPFTNLERRFLDPCANNGQIPIVIAERMMVGLSAMIPNEAERWEHIWRNQIFCYEIDEKKYQFMRSIFPVGANIICGDFLKEAAGTYDAIIANPPHNVKLLNRETARIVSHPDDCVSAAARIRIDAAFVAQSWELLEHGGTQVFLIPSGWVKLSSWRNFRRWMESKSFQVAEHKFNKRNYSILCFTK